MNGCDYCLSAHTYLGLNLAKIGPEEIALNRKGASGDAKANAAVAFAAKVAQERGHVSRRDIAAVRDAGFTDAQIVEIVARRRREHASPTSSTRLPRPTSTSRWFATTKSPRPPETRLKDRGAQQRRGPAFTQEGDHVLWIFGYRRDAERPGHTGGDGGWSHLGKFQRPTGCSIDSLRTKPRSSRIATASTLPRFRRPAGHMSNTEEVRAASSRWSTRRRWRSPTIEAIGSISVLPIASIVGERQRLVVDHLEEAARTSSMLDVWPAGSETEAI